MVHEVKNAVGGYVTQVLITGLIELWEYGPSHLDPRAIDTDFHAPPVSPPASTSSDTHGGDRSFTRLDQLFDDHCGSRDRSPCQNTTDPSQQGLQQFDGADPSNDSQL